MSRDLGADQVVGRSSRGCEASTRYPRCDVRARRGTRHKGWRVGGFSEAAIFCSSVHMCRRLCCVTPHLVMMQMRHQRQEEALFSCNERGGMCLADACRLRAIPTQARGVAALHVRCRSVPAGPAAPHSRQRMQAACSGARLRRGSAPFLCSIHLQAEIR